MKSRTTLRLAAFIVALLPALFAPPLVAQTPVSFSPANEGIDRAPVSTLVRAANGDMLAGTPYGLYRMPSGTTRWEKEGLDKEFHLIERMPDGTLLAGTERGIERSSDNGMSWSVVHNSGRSIGDFAFNTKGNVIAVTLNGSSSGGHSLYLSSDEGATWEWLPVHFATQPHTRIVSIGDRFVIGSTSGVQVSDRNGIFWDTTSLIDTVRAIGVTGDGVLVAAASHRNVPHRIYESSDTGRTWQAVDSGISAGELIAGGSGSYFIMSTVFYSDTVTDPPSVWRRRPGRQEREIIDSSEGATALAVENEELWLAVDNTIRKRSEEVDDWTDRSDGLQSFGVHHIVARGDAIYLLAPHHIHAGHLSYQLFRTRNQGEQWEPIADRFAGTVLETDRFGNLYAARVTQPWSSVENGFFVRGRGRYETAVSNDGGVTWRTIGPGQISHIADDPSGLIAMSMTSEDGGRDRTPELNISRDSGRSWVRLTDPGMALAGRADENNAAEIAGDGSVLFTAHHYDSENGVSRPYLARYTPATGQVETVVDSFSVRDIVRASDGSLLAIVTTGEPGIRRSTDNGRTWSVVGEGMVAGSLDDIGGEIIFGENDIYSNDNGESWFRSGDYTRQVAFGPDGLLYSMTSSNIRRSSTRAVSWVDPQFTDLPPLPERFLADSSGYFFVGSRRDGIHRSSLPTLTVAVDARRDGERLTVVDADDGLHIITDVARPTAVTVELYDLLGRRRMAVEGRAAAAGEHRMSMERPELPAGVYVVVVRVDERIMARTIVVR